MRREKTAKFLADCLSNMPKQTGEIKAVVDAVIAGLTRIANGQEWPEDEALSAYWAAWDLEVAGAGAAAWAMVNAAAWTAWADDWAAAAKAPDWAARAHPDPNAERARQAIVREKLGLNTKQEAD